MQASGADGSADRETLEWRKNGDPSVSAAAKPRKIRSPTD